MSNIALFIDIDNAKVNLAVFNNILEVLKKRGSLVYTKVYGFNERKHIKFDEVIEKYGFDSAPTMRYKKRTRSQLDSRIIIDAMRVFYTSPHVDTFCFIAGDGDLVPLLSFLRAGGKKLMTVHTDAVDGNDHMYDEKVQLDIQYNKPVKLSKKQLNEKLKQISTRSAQIMGEEGDTSTEQREELINEIEEILATKTDDTDEEEKELYSSLESLLDILRL